MGKLYSNSSSMPRLKYELVLHVLLNVVPKVGSTIDLSEPKIWRLLTEEMFLIMTQTTRFYFYKTDQHLTHLFDK